MTLAVEPLTTIEPVEVLVPSNEVPHALTSASNFTWSPSGSETVALKITVSSYVVPPAVITVLPSDLYCTSDVGIPGGVFSLKINTLLLLLSATNRRSFVLS